jgi:release factor glutamine methyltransferase
VLGRAGASDRGTDCEQLLAHAARKDRSWILLNRDRHLPKCALREFRSLVRARASGTPVPYLIGSVEFFGLELKIGRGVYIPKWETELLVEVALEYLGAPRRSDLTWGKTSRPALVHEVGTGSGAIALAIANHAPHAEIVASDLSAFALSLARTNSVSNGVAEQIQFCQGDMQSPLAGVPDLVVANLPYICVDSDLQLPEDVRAQPRSSLLSRNLGLGHIGRLLKTLVVKPGGRVMLEIGFDQANGVRSLCDGKPGLSYQRTIQDLAGLDRIAVIAAS